MTRHPTCARCGQPAVMWSGAFGAPWIGWCSNVCKNAWLNGDKTSDDSAAKPVDRRSREA